MREKIFRRKYLFRSVSLNSFQFFQVISMGLMAIVWIWIYKYFYNILCNFLKQKTFAQRSSTGPLSTCKWHQEIIVHTYIRAQHKISIPLLSVSEVPPPPQTKWKVTFNQTKKQLCFSRLLCATKTIRYQFSQPHSTITRKSGKNKMIILIIRQLHL